MSKLFIDSHYIAEWNADLTSKSIEERAKDNEININILEIICFLFNKRNINRSYTKLEILHYKEIMSFAIVEHTDVGKSIHTFGHVGIRLYKRS